jgi:hypothetical protein
MNAYVDEGENAVAKKPENVDVEVDVDVGEKRINEKPER